MKKIHLYILAALILISVGIGIMNKGDVKSFKREVASKSDTPPYYYRVRAPSIHNSEMQVVWPAYSPLDVLSHPAEFCAQPFSRKNTYVVERLNDEEEYISCGSCESFKCGQEKENEPQDSNYDEALKNYINISAKNSLVALLSKAESAPSKDCDASLDIWPCNVVGSINGVVDTLRKIKFPKSVRQEYFKKASNEFDEISVAKNIKLALSLISPEMKKKTISHLKSFSIQKDPHILGRKVDSMYMTYVFTTGVITLKESYAVNDSYKEVQVLDNVNGILSFVTVLHEYGHFLDDLFSSRFTKFNLSSSREWQEFSKTDDPVSFYSMYSWKENFAESFAAYLLDPLFQCYSPERYNKLTEIIQINEAIYGSARPYSNIDCDQPIIKKAINGRRKMLREFYKSSAYAMFDEIPFYLEKSLEKKPPGGFCRKDNFCDNGEMGCDANYREGILGQVGRCRGFLNTLEKGKRCDSNSECISKACSGFIDKRCL